MRGAQSGHVPLIARPRPFAGAADPCRVPALELRRGPATLGLARPLGAAGSRELSSSPTPASPREGGLSDMTIKPVLALIAATALLAPAVASAQSGDVRAAAPTRSLDGSGNNLAHPTWGQAGAQYLRVAPATYADGIKKPVAGPPTRYVSNRVFNDVAQNLFLENRVSQWGFVWGQFMDHTFGLRQETGGENAPIGFSVRDPLEEFRNDFGAIDFSRTPAAPGTGTRSVRQEINTESSYIDGASVYGNSADRLEWLREGPVN